MTILHNQCLPTELAKPANQAVIAATFEDCLGNPLTPGTQIAKCSDIPAIPAAQTLSLSGQNLTLSGGGGTITLPDSDDQTLSITGNVLAISGGNSVTLPTAPASALAIQDEAAALGNAGTLNFVGPGVTASVSGGVATVNIPGATASTPVGVQDEGAVVVASPTAVNFVGAGVTVTNAAGVATVNIPGGTTSHTTFLSSCPATGPTVAPTSEGHYFWTSSIGEKWQWIYGDAAPFVCGELYSERNFLASHPLGAPAAIQSHTMQRDSLVRLTISARATEASGAMPAVYRGFTLIFTQNGTNTTLHRYMQNYSNGQDIYQTATATFEAAAGDIILFAVDDFTLSGMNNIATNLEYVK